MEGVGGRRCQIKTDNCGYSRIMLARGAHGDGGDARIYRRWSFDGRSVITRPRCIDADDE